MFDSTAQVSPQTLATPIARWHQGAPANAPIDFASCLRGIALQKRLVHDKEHVFRAGQTRSALYLIHSGCFKTSVLSEDGREKITGFRMRGDLLGLDALGSAHFACDAVALDTGVLLEIPSAQLSAELPDFQEMLTAALASEIRRDWNWMLTTSTLGAEQRVVTFLLDLAKRQLTMGYSPRQLVLRMTRAELGNFLALQLETVTRALSHLDAIGLIKVDRREIRIEDSEALQAMIGMSRTH